MKLCLQVILHPLFHPHCLKSFFFLKKKEEEEEEEEG